MQSSESRAQSMLSVSALIDNVEVFNILLEPSNATSDHGFIGLGTGNHGRAQFDNFKLSSATKTKPSKHNSHRKTVSLERQLANLMTRNKQNDMPVVEAMLSNSVPRNPSNKRSSLDILLQMILKHQIKPSYM